MQRCSIDASEVECNQGEEKEKGPRNDSRIQTVICMKSPSLPGWIVKVQRCTTKEGGCGASDSEIYGELVERSTIKPWVG